MANDKCMYGCRRIPTTPEFGDVCNQCMKVFYLGMMEYKEAIARVRELADHFINCSDDCDCERCLEWPTAIIKALEGEQ